MAIQLIKQNSKFNNLHQHFYIDSLSDLDLIESEYKCQIGDVAELPDGMQYQRHSDDYQGQKWEYWKGGGSGGSDLPDVTVEDNGDILTVVDGAWAKATPSGGVLVVGMDIATYTLNKTWTEIKNADYPVLVVEANENIKQWMNIVSAEYDGGLYNITVLDESSPMVFATDTANGYPVLDTGD